MSVTNAIFSINKTPEKCLAIAASSLFGSTLCSTPPLAANVASFTHSRRLTRMPHSSTPAGSRQIVMPITAVTVQSGWPIQSHANSLSQHPDGDTCLAPCCAAARPDCRKTNLADHMSLRTLTQPPKSLSSRSLNSLPVRAPALPVFRSLLGEHRTTFSLRRLSPPSHSGPELQH